MENTGITKRFNPWADLATLQQEMNRLFQSSMGTSPRAGLFGSDYLPPIDIVRSKNNDVVVRMDAPGMTKEDLEISVVGDSLIIRGEKKRDVTQQTGENVYRHERFFGTFERVIDLPAAVDTEKTTATFQDGVLEIVAPVRPEARPKQISINVAK